MSVLQNVKFLHVEFIFNNRIHIFFMPILLTLFWDIALSFNAPIEYFFMIFFNTAGVYIQNMISDYKEDAINYSHTAKIFYGNSDISRYAMFSCYLMSFALGALAGWQFILYGMILNILGGLYGHQFIGKDGRNGFRIKATPWLKNGYSAVFWSAVLLITPFVYTHHNVPGILLYAIACNFVIAFFVEFLWDVRDVEGDRQAGVRTITQHVGEKNSLYILHALNVATIVLVFFGITTGLLPPAFWTLVVHCIVAVFFIQWYFTLKDKQWASHIYIVAGSVTLLTAILISAFSHN